MSAQTIDILLATFNGAKFLRQQLDSIVHQTHSDWNLLISDDGSTDETLQIIDQFIQKFPKQVRHIQQDQKGNASDNFLGILKHARANYIAFCDQDDYWEPTKLEESLSLLIELEQRNEKALVFSDMLVVDEKLEVLNSSFMQKQRLKSEWSNKKYKVFAQSMAAGCAMLFTKALAKNLHPINSKIFQHDHWLMIHAAQKGEIAYLDKKTVHYRQHGFNAVGANNLDTVYYARKAVTFKTLYERWKDIKSCFGKEIKIWRIALEKLKISINRVIN